MNNADVSRRTLLRSGGSAFAGLTVLQVTAPARALGEPGEEVIPWLDQPPPDLADNLQVWERLDSWLTPTDRFLNVNHFGQPESLDETTWRVGITGLVVRPQFLTISELKLRERREVDFTLECSGNNGF